MSLASAALGRWNIDISRHARERQHPADYLRQSYYENWLVGLEKLLVESGLVSAEELASGSTDPDAAPGPAAPGPDVFVAGLAKGRPVDVAPTRPPAFKPGDRVLVRNMDTSGHTRAPRYTRGHKGVVATHHGCHVYPDTHTVETEEGHHLYSVRFAATELWGPEATGDQVFVDLWEPYLEAV